MFLFIYDEEILGGMLLPQLGIGPSDAVSGTQVFASCDDFVPLGKKDQILCELGCCDKRRIELVPKSWRTLQDRSHPESLICVVPPCWSFICIRIGHVTFSVQ